MFKFFYVSFRFWIYSYFYLQFEVKERKWRYRLCNTRNLVHLNRIKKKILMFLIEKGFFLFWFWWLPHTHTPFDWLNSISFFLLLFFQLQIHHQNDPNRPRFVAVTTLEDVQAVRCAEFHPNGRVYSVGSNSKTFRICEYPSLSEIR